MQDVLRARASSWTSWLDARGRPLVLVLAATWGDADPTLLEAIRAELRTLGTGMLVVAADAAFCFRPEGSGEEAIPPELLAPNALGSLYRRLDLRSRDVKHDDLVLTLLDDEANVRMQSVRDAPPSCAAAVLETLRWARTSAAFGAHVLFSRRDAVMLSLIGAVALSSPACGSSAGRGIPSVRAGVVAG